MFVVNYHIYIIYVLEYMNEECNILYMPKAQGYLITIVYKYNVLI